MAALHILHFGPSLNTAALLSHLFVPFTHSSAVCFSKLPSWARAVVPKIFYVTEKAWNYYPYTITGRVESHNTAHFRSLKNEKF